MNFEIEPRVFRFKKPARTSRGVYTEHKSFIIKLQCDGDDKPCLGECSVLPDLSCDVMPEDLYKDIIAEAMSETILTRQIPYEKLRRYPSILFGIETVFHQKIARHPTLFDTPFARGEEGIPINGLVWMGSYEDMERQMEEKLRAGFRCVKLKIGAIDWEQEVRLIRHLREQYSAEQIELRVDANGAFTPENVMQRLETLSRLDIHSIEQPIAAHQWEKMAELCRKSPVPIALDEELIGVNSVEEKQQLLDAIHPQYIVVKPSLHGGMHGTREWIEHAMQRGIGSWITSALESNVGLNAIAHTCACAYSSITMAQGLGTGLLYADNIDMPLEIRDAKLWVKPSFEKL